MVQYLYTAAYGWYLSLSLRSAYKNHDAYSTCVFRSNARCGVAFDLKTRRRILQLWTATMRMVCIRHMRQLCGRL